MPIPRLIHFNGNTFQCTWHTPMHGFHQTNLRLTDTTQQHQPLRYAIDSAVRNHAYAFEDGNSFSFSLGPEPDATAILQAGQRLQDVIVQSALHAPDDIIPADLRAELTNAANMGTAFQPTGEGPLVRCRVNHATHVYNAQQQPSTISAMRAAEPPFGVRLIISPSHIYINTNHHFAVMFYITHIIWGLPLPEGYEHEPEEDVNDIFPPLA